jgi:hypothetical protein
MKIMKGSVARSDAGLTAKPQPFNSKVPPDRPTDSVVDRLVADLEEKGITVLPPIFTQEQIQVMKKAFESRLHGARWNDLDGYESEPLRLVLQDVLTLEQGFVDLAIHPLVANTLARYVGKSFALTEARGWKSIPTKRDFQGWHGDAWYDESKVQGIAKEVKMAMYLTDVKSSGAFNYMMGTHQKQHPRVLENREVQDFPRSKVLEVTGPAGTVFMFDSSGTHKQGVPILEPRMAVFYNYHSPQIPLSKEAFDYYRYHPLTLNAAFLGDLSQESQRILGFGDKTRYQPGFRRTTQYKLLYRAVNAGLTASMKMTDLRERAVERFNRLLKRKG